MTPIARVAWAVPPTERAGRTRPEQLVAWLTRAGAVAPQAQRIYHGRSNTAPGWQRASILLPSRSARTHTADAAVLSPVFLAGLRATVSWIDLYDDWSTAPDINPVHRFLASRGYAALRAERCRAKLVTVNSAYMADRVAPVAVEIVPNGVDPRLGHLRTAGTEQPRLLVLGHFFKGRTDFGLLESVARRPDFSEVVIGGPGSSPALANVINRLRRTLGTRLHVHQWLGETELAGLAGSRTVALIPNRVSDYTLSQDLMKAYQFLALGIRVICPRLVWPAALPIENALLLDRGVDLDAVLGDWLELPAPDEAWRKDFVAQHSWEARASHIGEVLRARGQWCS